MSEPEANRFEVVVEKGSPRGDLYELEHKTYYHVVDRQSQETVMTFEELMEASLSRDTGLWDDYTFSGAREVTIAPNGLSVVIRYHDGLEKTVPLPQYGPWGWMDLDEFFAGYDESRRIFEALQATIDALAEGEAFAWTWMPKRYLGGGHAPLVLPLGFCRWDDSPRWKQIVEPAPGRFARHHELYSASEIDDEGSAWLRAAWATTGWRQRTDAL